MLHVALLQMCLHSHMQNHLLHAVMPFSLIEELPSECSHRVSVIVSELPLRKHWGRT